MKIKVVARVWEECDLQLSKEQGGSSVSLDWKGKNTQWLETTEKLKINLKYFYFPHMAVGNSPFCSIL